MEIDQTKLKGWPPATSHRENPVLGICLSEQYFANIRSALAIFSRGLEYSKGANLVQVEFDRIENILGLISIEQMVKISKASDFERLISFSIQDVTGTEILIELPYRSYNDLVTLVGRLISERKRREEKKQA
jgi:hypothetical protein